MAWKDVEPVEGAGYNWDAPAVKALENDMITAAQSNLNVILVVRGSPRWAVTPYQADCAPINPAKYAAFAAFLEAVVERYSQPPYNVKYWEIGNEPDAYIFSRDSVFGCWGVTSDPYYGGEAYGRALKTAALAMKAVNPEIKIMNGGLLLAHPYNPERPDETRAGRFFEGMLRVGAGEVIDIVSFHSYTYYGPGSAEPLGPPVDWRIGYLQDLLRQYNLPKLPMIRTEAALLCFRSTPECRWAQADLLTRLYVWTIRDNLLGTIWYVYDSDSYHNTALIEPTDVFVPRPAYFAYRQAASILVGATYLGRLEGQAPTIEGYRFQRGDETRVIVWSESYTAFAVPVPIDATVRCYDRDGGAIACINDNGTVRGIAQPSPQYVIVK
ncbi:MAG: hypothetical protein HC822_09895 [Oscillochloris sp.]|nr:hypothetical protein [Oscillochloris sp.]